MIIGIGTDIVEVSRIQEAIEKYGKRFLDKIYTQTEQDYCNTYNDTKYVHYAARFAAKESFSKVIGTGLSSGFKFIEVGIKNKESGEPVIDLTGGMAEKYGHYKTFVSLSHTDNNAIAYLLMEEK